MDCKGCIWFKIYDFIFPDGTKTMTCEKYNKHLGFTSCLLYTSDAADEL